MSIFTFFSKKKYFENNYPLPDTIELKYRKYSQASRELNIFRYLFSTSFSGVACTLVFVSLCQVVCSAFLISVQWSVVGVRFS